MELANTARLTDSGKNDWRSIDAKIQHIRGPLQLSKLTVGKWLDAPSTLKPPCCPRQSSSNPVPKNQVGNFPTWEMRELGKAGQHAFDLQSSRRLRGVASSRLSDSCISDQPGILQLPDDRRSVGDLPSLTPFFRFAPERATWSPTGRPPGGAGKKSASEGGPSTTPLSRPPLFTACDLRLSRARRAARRFCRTSAPLLAVRQQGMRCRGPDDSDHGQHEQPIGMDRIAE